MLDRNENDIGGRARVGATKGRRLLRFMALGVALAIVASPVPALAEGLPLPACSASKWRITSPDAVEIRKRMIVSWDVNLSSCPSSVLLINGLVSPPRGTIEDTILNTRVYHFAVHQGKRTDVFLENRIVRAYRNLQSLVTQAPDGRVRINTLHNGAILFEGFPQLVLPGESTAPKKLLGAVDWDLEHGNESLVWTRFDPELGLEQVVEWPMGFGDRFAEKRHAHISEDGIPYHGRADFDGVGLDDMVWRDPATTMLWTSRDWPFKSFHDSVQGVPNSSAEWKIVGHGQFSYDDQEDTVWQHANGQVAIAIMDGSKRLATSYRGIPATTQSWKVQTIGDFDGDWLDDILWRHTSGALTIWFQGSHLTTGSPTYQNAPNQHVGLDWNVIGVADHDHDGKADIFWRNNDGTFAIWRMEGAQMRGAWYPGKVDPAWKFIDILQKSFLV